MKRNLLVSDKWKMTKMWPNIPWFDLMKLKIKTDLYNTLSEFKALSRKTCLTPEICLYIQNKYKNTT